MSCRSPGTAAERGTSLIELAISAGIFMVVLAVVLNAFEAGVRTQRGHDARAGVLVEAGQIMDSVTKDVRQALRVYPGSGATRLEIDTLVGGAERHVVYEVEGRSLRRIVDGAPAALSARVSAAGLFGYDEDPADAAPTLITVSLTLSSGSSAVAPVRLDRKVQLRNAAAGTS